MKSFGKKEIFAVEYEILDMENGYFEMWVHNTPICCYLKNNTMEQYRWNLSYIVEWLNKNIPNLLKENGFPLPIKANTSIDFYIKSGDYDSEDIDEFDRWFEKRQEWYFCHSWYSNRAGSYLAEVFFRRIGNKIEIEWDNTKLYDKVHFMNPKGLYYIDIDLFKQIISDFVLDFNIQKP